MLNVKLFSASQWHVCLRHITPGTDWLITGPREAQYFRHVNAKALFKLNLYTDQWVHKHTLMSLLVLTRVFTIYVLPPSPPYSSLHKTPVNHGKCNDLQEGIVFVFEVGRPVVITTLQPNLGFRCKLELINRITRLDVDKQHTIVTWPYNSLISCIVNREKCDIFRTRTACTIHIFLWNIL